jgi:prephenate dehydratase
MKEMVGLADKSSSIYYLGPAGTHSHEAAWQFANRFHVDPSFLKPEASIAKVINQVMLGNSLSGDFACVPLENSIQGSVTMTWDRLYQILHSDKGQGVCVSGAAFTDPLGWSGFGIRAVLTLPISHYLLSKGPLMQESVTHVYSHPQALAQCKMWMEENLPQALQVPVASTAEAASLVRDFADKAKVAIGSERAGKEYGLCVSPCPIQDVNFNFTRFGLLANSPLLFSRASFGRYTTSICLSGVQNQPGGLLKALSPFYQNGLNLTRIESRPVGHELGTYLFYLDVETSETKRSNRERSKAWEIVLGELKNENIEVVYLGSYPLLDS